MGTVLNRYEKKAILFFTLNIFLLVLIAVLLSFLIDSHIMDIRLRVFVYLVLILSFLFLSYIVAKYFLTPMFETKHMLELLLKDTLHELNIPLSVIQANLQMLKRGELDTKRLKRFSRIERAGEDLKRLYQDIDYYIKREVRYDLVESFELISFLELEVEKVQYQNQDQKIVLEYDIKPIIQCDKRGFSKVIGNLLSNAIKYNKENNDIIIKVENSRVSIKDSGIGMSESELFKIFDRYYQADSSKSGFGIGLSIVKAFCDEQKIYLNFNSKLHVGTTIVLDLKNIMQKEEK